MIYGLTPVKAAQALLGRLAAIEVNALLQLGIEVLEKQDHQRFLIRMGQHTFTTKSDTPLVPGREYWVEMAQTREGIVHLRRLHPKPLFLGKKYPPDLDRELFDALTDGSAPGERFKKHLLHTLASTETKEEFQNILQLLLSLHHGIFTLPIGKKWKKTLFQFRSGKKKSANLNKNSVEFYAAMNNLGPVRGTIFHKDDRMSLSIELFYPKSLKLLEREKDELRRFDRIEIRLAEEFILPMWENEKSGLLDIKG
ncbi:hypothetical protein [Hydrogenimonas sp.]